jgi:dihydroorotate dehydrogenase
MGFGFETVGTITNLPYKGNPKPRLGRLPKSKSLMVNKGFKSSGADFVSEMLSDKNFDIPVGISIGRTNCINLKTQKQSVADIVEAFKTFENAKVKNAYYELNISCPNLIHAGSVSFYPPKNLEELLVAIDKLKLKKPVLIKMPIEKSDREVLAMLKVIAKHSPVGVIFGNLQKDRNHKSLDKTEVKKFKVGNFSGKPTFDRSNELISLAYKKYKDRFVIVGCGGVFNASDAWEKITRGASLIQLITGLIYEGPQLVSQINQGLVHKLELHGYSNINSAVGTAS